MKGHDLISRFTKESIAIDPLNECLLSGGARVTLGTYSHSRQLTNFCFLTTLGDHPEIALRLNPGNTIFMFERIWREFRCPDGIISFFHTKSRLKSETFQFYSKFNELAMLLEFVWQGLSRRDKSIVLKLSVLSDSFGYSGVDIP